jgi:glycosyltransferase involved in cell wall biosynthesis
MNILFFDAIDTETFGGYENWILLTARHLARRGHGITVAGRPGSEYLRRLRQLEEKVRILEVAVSGDFNPATIRVLRSYLELNDIDLITANFNKDLRLGGLAARWHGRTKVIWRLGLDVTKNTWIHRHLTPKLIDGVIVPSEGLKQQVIRHGYLPEDMVRVIYNGTEVLDVHRPDPGASRAIRDKYGLPGSSVIAVSVGRFVDQKGHAYLVEAAPAIVSKHPEIRFLWLGNGPNEPMLRERIRQLSLERYVVFAGMLDDIAPELAGSDLMIHPAVEEPFSHGILECMRAGMPIVSSRVGGTPEAIQNGITGMLVEPRQPDVLARAVNDLLDDRDKMRTFGLAGQRRWRELFTVDVMVDRTEAYFKQIVEGRPVNESAKTP